MKANTTFRPRRDDTRVRFDQALAERARWHNPMFVAKQLQTALENPGRPFDNYLLSRSEAASEFSRLNPSAIRLLGDATVAASIPKKSACRWCHAALYARVHQVSPPDPTSPAIRSLLGDPCGHQMSLKAQMAALRPRFEASRRAVAAQARATALKSLIASGATVTRRDTKGRPTRLRTRAAAVTCASCGVPGGGPGCNCKILTGHTTLMPWTSSTPRLNRVETGMKILTPRGFDIRGKLR